MQALVHRLHAARGHVADLGRVGVQRGNDVAIGRSLGDDDPRVGHRDIGCDRAGAGKEDVQCRALDHDLRIAALRDALDHPRDMARQRLHHRGVGGAGERADAVGPFHDPAGQGLVVAEHHRQIGAFRRRRVAAAKPRHRHLVMPRAIGAVAVHHRVLDGLRQRGHRPETKDQLGGQTADHGQARPMHGAGGRRQAGRAARSPGDGGAPRAPRCRAHSSPGRIRTPPLAAEDASIA